MRSVWFVMLVGCIEYGVEKRDDTVDTPIESGETDTVESGIDDTSVPDTCSLEVVESIEVALNDSCDVPPSTGSFTPVIEWNLAGYNGLGPPAVAQLDDDDGDGDIDSDDNPDIVYMSYSNGLMAVDGVTGLVKWQTTAVNSYNSGVSIADVDGDGVPEIVAAEAPSAVALFDNTGTMLWKTTGLSNGPLALYMFPAVADMDADGTPEIIAGRNILDPSGTVIGTGAYGIGASEYTASSYYGSMPGVVDLDGDGLLEVVVGNAAYNKDGSTKYASGDQDGMVAIADFDGDGEPEIAVASRARLFTLETDMTPTGWSVTFPSANFVGPLAADDMDGDGLPEIVASGGGDMRVYRWGGALVWSQTVQDVSGAAGPILYDFELDGYPEVVFADEVKVRVFNGLDGAVKLESSEHSSGTGFETPIVADVDGDGEVEIVMCHGSGTVGLTVYGDASNSWPAGRQIWNQHAYSITNIEDDGAVPNPQAANHVSYNNWRSGDAGLPPSRWNDLSPEVVEVCTEECPDTLYMMVRMWNQGTEEVDAGVGVVVRAGDGGAVVASATYPDPIPSGWSSTGIELSFAVASLGGKTPVVEVDRDAALGEMVDECVEDNNPVVTEECP
jgi:hypothetical protein